MKNRKCATPNSRSAPGRIMGAGGGGGGERVDSILNNFILRGLHGPAWSARMIKCQYPQQLKMWMLKVLSREKRFRWIEIKSGKQKKARNH